MKHILPLTYEPKIPDVRSGKCTQTIRPKSKTRPKKVGDLIMFHGWSGRPYHSEWSWRTGSVKFECGNFKLSNLVWRIFLNKPDVYQCAASVLKFYHTGRQTLYDFSDGGG